MILPRPPLQGWARFLCALAVTLAFATSAAAFGFEDVAREARALAAKRFQPTAQRVPRELRDISYDAYRGIRFRPDASLWRRTGSPFEIQFFHLGFNYVQPVRIAEIVDGRAVAVPFRREQFDYSKSGVNPEKLEIPGFAGFRVHYPINTPRYKDEVVVFLGASYFRALGKGQTYGLSARGLALDTGLASGEEFPQFTAFWIERPGPNAKELVIYALLESRRAAGAYRFVVRPGATTTMDVRLRLFLREHVTSLGIAPLTSMYRYGENQRGSPDEYRPEVHDSDGLSIQSGTGEWIWRPLTNPRRLLVSTFALSNPAGFGVMQRDREFAHYEDLEARYDRRPSGWVVPKGKWGSGRVTLVLLPTPDEFNDNVVAFWVPDAVPAVREPFDLEYQLQWQLDNEARPPQSWVSQTRRGLGPNHNPAVETGFHVDFEGPALKRLPKDAAFDAVITVDGNAEVLEQVAMRNEVTGGARIFLRIRRRDDAKPVEMRGYLKADGNAISETWSYLLPPS